MNLAIGVIGMVVLAGLYVGLALADRGRSGCGGCGLMELDDACGGGGCATGRPPAAGGPGRAGDVGSGRAAAGPEWGRRAGTDDDEAQWSPGDDGGWRPDEHEEWKR